MMSETPTVPTTSLAETFSICCTAAALQGEFALREDERGGRDDLSASVLRLRS